MSPPTKSGIYVQTLKDILIQTAYTPANINFTLATYKIAAFSNAASDAAQPLNFSGTGANQSWSNAYETVSTTNWPTGGILLSVANAGGTVTPTLAEGTTGSIRYDHTSDLSVASTTFSTGPYGVIIYADPVTAPNADPMLVAVCFGSAYPTNNGTFGIQWSATGIFEIDITP